MDRIQVTALVLILLGALLPVLCLIKMRMVMVVAQSYLLEKATLQKN